MGAAVGISRSAGRAEQRPLARSSRFGVRSYASPATPRSPLPLMYPARPRQAASYEFTTLTCVPGIVRYRGAKIQMLDLPGIIEGAKDGKGRGRQVRMMMAPGCAVLCCAVLCCAVLCCAVLCCAVLCCAVLCVLCCAVLCCAVGGVVFFGT